MLALPPPPAGAPLPKAPPAEWAKIMSFGGAMNNGKKICTFWNSSSGCSKGAACEFAHACIQCEGRHKFAGKH